MFTESSKKKNKMSSGQHNIAAGTKNTANSGTIQQKKTIFYKEEKRQKKTILTFIQQRWMSNRESAVKILVGIFTYMLYMYMLYMYAVCWSCINYYSE
jgi:hypothetical protein